MEARPAPSLDASVLGDARTIAAVATAPGRGALALVRISGPDVAAIAQRLLRPPPALVRRATHVQVIDPDDGSVLDDAIAMNLQRRRETIRVRHQVLDQRHPPAKDAGRPLLGRQVEAPCLTSRRKGGKAELREAGDGFVGGEEH